MGSEWKLEAGCGAQETFCLWEVGYTQFAIKDAMDERKRIERARDANIEFQ